MVPPAADSGGADKPSVNPGATEAGPVRPHEKGNTGEASAPVGEEWAPEGLVPLDAIWKKGTLKRRWYASDEYVSILIISSRCSCTATVLRSSWAFLLCVHGVRHQAAPEEEEEEGDGCPPRRRGEAGGYPRTGCWRAPYCRGAIGQGSGHGGLAPTGSQLPANRSRALRVDGGGKDRRRWFGGGGECRTG